MARRDLVMLVPPDNRDAVLISQCASFDELDEQILEHNIALADDAGRGLGRAQPHERQDECDKLLVQLCQHRADTLAGIAARVRTLLRYAPERFAPDGADGYDELMIAALLRDLAAVLKVHDS